MEYIVHKKDKQAISAGGKRLSDYLFCPHITPVACLGYNRGKHCQECEEKETCCIYFFRGCNCWGDKSKCEYLSKPVEINYSAVPYLTEMRTKANKKE